MTALRNHAQKAVSWVKSVGKFGLFGIAMFSLGSIYTALLMIFPAVARTVLGQ